MHNIYGTFSPETTELELHICACCVLRLMLASNTPVLLQKEG